LELELELERRLEFVESLEKFIQSALSHNVGALHLDTRASLERLAIMANCSGIGGPCFTSIVEQCRSGTELARLSGTEVGCLRCKELEFRR
jgi:hypothetical protein